MKTETKRINDVLVRRNPDHPRNWDVIDHRGKVTFTGTLAEIRRASKVVPVGDGHYINAK